VEVGGYHGYCRNPLPGGEDAGDEEVSADHLDDAMRSGSREHPTDFILSFDIRDVIGRERLRPNAIGRNDWL